MFNNYYQMDYFWMYIMWVKISCQLIDIYMIYIYAWERIASKVSEDSVKSSRHGNNDNNRRNEQSKIQGGRQIKLIWCTHQHSFINEYIFINE